ncbi:GTPase ObgE [Frigoriflavimonas asaccharolytica]|uniref:GTPase Obg n=1 Tax=Frigoriflavimonas asaccharolytica TaxID=2735899 RepID=A0A8J8K9P6_9FLAO|nr:GTPase ObgE [Frigoriflavimonas asaccharolytica]NRS93901.1 GTP-binding protein [Frigoriflavimonas asaccharolytica]
MSNFVDYVRINCKAGHGGGGSAHLKREKYMPKGGPDGGDGGRGGHVIMKGNANQWTLLPLRYTRHVHAQRGVNGAKSQLTGAFGEDEYIEVPIGTIAKNEEGEILGEIMEDGQEIIILKGGKGGKGNEFFKTSTNQTPRYAQPGEAGEEAMVVFELKILADVGLVGFPNAGKSTLLASISAAKPKIADYAFTTLTPNLGIVEYRNYQSFVMADIPGIIEGASQGKGLGHRFLRHIERNSILLFMIPSDSENHFEEFKILERELLAYNPEMMDKEFIISISKADLLDDELKKLISVEFPENRKPIFFSGVSQEGLMALKDVIWEKLHG